MRMLLMVIASALLVTSCGSSEGGQPQAGQGEATSTPGAATPTQTTQTPPETTTPAASTPQTPKPLPPPPGGAQADVPAALLDQVKADAAKRAGVTPAEVRVVGSTAQTWSDGSLGCPKPGEAYIQVQVEGFQIFAEAAGRMFDYRTSQSAIKLCEK